jgi:VanZ family protein
LRYDLAILLNQNITHFSKSDFTTNFILFVILGVLCGGYVSQLKSDYKFLFGLIASTLFIFTLSVSIELIQKYIPGRVSSLGDVLVDTGAGAAGILLLVFFKIAGVIDYFQNVFDRLVKENPAKLVWILLGLVIILICLYPYEFDLNLHNVAAQIRRFDTRSFLLEGNITLKFFYQGIIYFIWGVFCVAAGIKEKRNYYLEIAKNLCISCLLVFALEAGQIFFPFHIPSRLDIETYLFWLFMGFFVSLPYGIEKRKEYSVGYRNKKNDTISLLLWFCTIATLILIFIYGLRPFIFKTDSAFVKERLSGIEWIPFSTYVKYFNALSIEDASGKMLLYFTFGFESAYILRKSLPYSKYVPILVLILIVSIAAFIEIIQICIPERHPSVSDIIIAAAAGLLGIIFMSVRFKRKTKGVGWKSVKKEMSFPYRSYENN